MQGSSIPALSSSNASPSSSRSALQLANIEKPTNRRYSLQHQQQHSQIEKLQGQHQGNRRSNSGSSSTSSLRQTRADLQDGIAMIDRPTLQLSNPLSPQEEDAASIRSNNSPKNKQRRLSVSSQSTTTHVPGSPRSKAGLIPRGAYSPPSTPRLSSRTKILANSAALVDGVASPPLPFAYRTRSTESDARSSGESSTRPYLLGQQPINQVNRRLPSSPPAFLHSKETVTSTTGGLSLADRKKKLVSASGGSFEDSAPKSSKVESPQAKLIHRHGRESDPKGNNTSLTNPLPSTKSPVELERAVSTNRNIKEEKGDDTKSISGKGGIRKRFSELRENLFGEGQGSTAMSSSPSLFSNNATNYAKDENSINKVAIPSSFSASIDGKRLQPSRLQVPSMRTTPSYRSERSQTNSLPETDGGSIGPVKYQNAREAPFMELTASEDTSHSWITSLSSVSPPEIPDFASLHIDASSPRSNTESIDERLSPTAEDRARMLQRTSSWPPDEQRRGSFVSIKGNGTGTGYRFEKAASLVKMSPTLGQDPSRSPLSIRNLETVDIQPSKHTNDRKYSDASSIRSPPFILSDLATTLQSYRNNSTSSSQWETPRIPLISVPPSAIVDEAHEDSVQQASSPVAIDYPPQDYQRQKGRKGSVASSIRSVNSQPNSPINHTPRNSSLLLSNSKSPTTPTRSSSSRNSSFMTVNSSSAMQENWTLPENIRELINKREEKRKSEGSNKASLGGDHMAYTDSLGLSHQPGDGQRETLRYDFGTSPSSMITAHEVLSPQMDILGTMSESVTPPIASAAASTETASASSEPRRPSKNPLRAVSSSSLTTRSRQISGGEGNTLMAAATVAQGKRLISPPALGGERIRHLQEEKETEKETLEQHTPTRKMIEEVIQLSPVDIHNAITPGSIGEQNNYFAKRSTADVIGSIEDEKEQSLDEPIQLNEISKKSASEEDGESNFDKRKVEKENKSRKDGTSTPTSPTSSLKQLTSPIVRQSGALRKAAPAMLSNAFNRDKGTMEKLQSPESMSPGSLSNLKSKSRMRKWPFTRESVIDKDLSNNANQIDTKDNANSLGKGSKIGKNLRSKKDNISSAAIRPAITRIFNESVSTIDHDLDTDESGDEAIDDAASILTHGEGKSPGSKRAIEFPSDSVPGTPIALNEEMSAEVKRVIRRRNIIRELVETERNYAADLIVIRDIYLARARSAVGINLETPLSGYITPPIQSPDVIVTLHQQSINDTPVSLGKPFFTSRNSRKLSSNDLQSSFSTVPAVSAVASPASFAASSSMASNRSSIYTVSSQTSQQSEASFPFQSTDAPPLPATPPNLAGLTSSESSIQNPSPSSSTFTTIAARSKSASTRPKTLINTNGLYLSSNTESNDPGLTLSDVRIIFTHLETCCSFAEDTASNFAMSMGTFARMKRVQPGDIKVEMDKEDDRIGEAFLNLMSKIRLIYLEYCSRHEYSMQRLQGVITSSPKANQFFKECTEVARKYTNAWDLASLLIKPVQRVLKYPLLLQQILNYTSTLHKDYENLQHSLEDMQGVADEINRVKKRRDLAEHLISGRLKEPYRLEHSPSSSAIVNTFKGKRRSDTKMSKDTEESMASLRAEDAALDRYTDLTKLFHKQFNRVRSLQVACLEWSSCLRESYNCQINVFLALRRTYRLRIQEQDVTGEVKNREVTGSNFKDESRLIKAYIKMLLKVLEVSWQQVDDSIQSDIVPMAMQISRLFESPRLVMSKRDDRLIDYHKLRHSYQYGKQLDRRMTDNALGFVALNAQLVEELPLFLAGIQSLLEVIIRKFAQIQTMHFDQVRQSMIQFWNERSEKYRESMPIFDDKRQCLVHDSNITKLFWNRHSVPAAIIDSLNIVHRRTRLSKEMSGGEENESVTSSGVSTPGLNTVSQISSSNTNVGLNLGLGQEMKRDSSRKGGTASSVSHTTSTSEGHQDDSSITRQIPAKPSLLRSLSGPIGKKKSSESFPPPLPLGASSKHVAPKLASSSASFASTSSRHKLNDLIYQVQEDGQKSFVQVNPMEFLENSNMVKRSSINAGELSNDVAALSSSFRSSRSFSQQSMSQFRVQRIAIREERISKVDVCLPPVEERLWNHGWPFINFTKGDVLQIICSEQVNSEEALFGRIDRTGDIGWAFARCFQEESSVTE